MFKNLTKDIQHRLSRGENKIEENIDVVKRFYNKIKIANGLSIGTLPFSVYSNKVMFLSVFTYYGTYFAYQSSRFFINELNNDLTNMKELKVSIKETIAKSVDDIPMNEYEYFLAKSANLAPFFN